MKKLRGLWPYLRRHLWPILGGVLALVLANIFQLQAARVVGEATDAVGAGRGTALTYARYGGLVVAFTLALGVFRYLMRLWIIGASRDIEQEFRNDIFARFQSLSPSFYDRNRTGDLMSRATNDVEAVRSFLGPGILQFSNTAILFPLAVHRLVSLDWKLASATLTPLIALPPLMNYFGNHVHRRFRAVQDHYSTISAMVQENLAGVRVVRSFVQEEAQIRQFEELNRRFIDLNLRLARIQAAFIPGLRLVAGSSLAMLLWVGGQRVIAEHVSIGTLVEFSVILASLFWPMIALGWTVSLMQRGAASMERIGEILKLEPEIPAPGGAGSPGGAGVSVTVSAPSSPEAASLAPDLSRPRPGAPAIEFRDLTFRYAPDLSVVLSHISVTVPEGGRLGVVGPTGSGKSTLASLLARLYPVGRGQLFVGGHDVNDLPVEALRDRISVVLQETFLFSDSIARNIAFGAPEADQAAIEAAARQAHLDGDIAGFPRGYETMLGERGINLSGGQKQRTAIARALLRDPRILVLDDALSAVDTETEERIIASLDEALRGRTAVIIAHRVSAVMHCDEIIVLDQGRIVERGTHDDLIAAGGLYAALFEKQLLSDTVDQS